ncbi:hypothetical protein ES705_44276 [subsurface metagenome]
MLRIVFSFHGSPHPITGNCWMDLWFSCLGASTNKRWTCGETETHYEEVAYGTFPTGVVFIPLGGTYDVAGGRGCIDVQTLQSTSWGTGGDYPMPTAFNWGDHVHTYPEITDKYYWEREEEGDGLIISSMGLREHEMFPNEAGGYFILGEYLRIPRNKLDIVEVDDHNIPRLILRQARDLVRDNQ